MIYYVDWDSKYATLVFADNVGQEFLATIQGAAKSSVSSKWEPPRVEPRQDPGESLQRLPDCPYLTIPFLVVNEKAIKALYPVLKNRVEFLGCEFDGDEKYTIVNAKYIFNIIPPSVDPKELRNLINNRSRSTLDPFQVPLTKIPKVPIFKIAGIESSGVFCTEVFKKLYDRHNLTGLKFVPFENI